MRTVIAHSDQKTKKLAAKIAKNFSGGVIALSGELGAGKTTFVQGFAKGLGITEKIISPTFVLIRQHQIPNTKKILYHIDLYRLENIKNIQELGLGDLWSNPSNIILIEWAEKIEKFLPKNTVKILIKKESENNRRIIIPTNFLSLLPLLLVLPFACLRLLN